MAEPSQLPEMRRSSKPSASEVTPLSWAASSLTNRPLMRYSRIFPSRAPAAKPPSGPVAACRAGVTGGIAQIARIAPALSVHTCTDVNSCACGSNQGVGGFVHFGSARADVASEATVGTTTTKRMTRLASRDAPPDRHEAVVRAADDGVVVKDAHRLHLRGTNATRATGHGATVGASRPSPPRAQAPHPLWGLRPVRTARPICGSSSVESS